MKVVAKKIKGNANSCSLIILVLMILVFFISAGCSKSEDNISNKLIINQTVQPTTVNFIGHWYKEGQRENLVRNFAREYGFKNQNININLKFPEEVYYNREDLRSNQKFVASLLTKEHPDWDIVRVNGEYQEIFQQCGDPDWPRKYLVDFSQIEEFRNGTLPELLTDEAKKAWNGIIPGPYIEGQFWALWCNKNVAKKVGIEVKQFGMTIDDFISYLKAVHNYNVQNPTNYITPIYESVDWPTTAALGIQLYASLLDNPKEFFSEEITEKRLNAWGKTLEVLEQIAPFKPLNPEWRKVNWGKTTASLLNEECLFYVNGSWMYNIWLGLDKEKINNCMPAEFPGFKTASVYPGGYQIMWAVLKNAPHKEEAIKFLLAMNKPAMAEMWVRYTKCPTGIKGNLTGVSFGKDQFENFSYHVQNVYNTNTYRYYESSTWVLDKQNSTTPIFFNEVIEGKLTASEAMHRIRQTLNLESFYY
jgi:ABC-type glycerol-3-phosphate transport system substrate-binding protein